MWHPKFYLSLLIASTIILLKQIFAYNLLGSSLFLPHFPQRILITPVLKELIKGTPLILLLESESSDLEILLRDTQTESLYNIVLYFNPTRNISTSIKPVAFSAKFTPFLCTFIFLIENSRTAAQANQHLLEFLKIGHPRTDRFLLVGTSRYLHSYYHAPVAIIDKFKNIIALSLDTGEIYQRILSRQLVRVSLKTVSWIIAKNLVFTGQLIRICGTRFPPFLDAVVDSSKPGKWKIVGVNIKMFQASSTMFNFTYVYNPVENWQPPGLRFPNGTWGGGKYSTRLIF